MKEKIYLIIGLMILFFALPFQSAFSQRQKSFVCVKTIKSSQSRIHSAEFSPDGKYILSVAEDRMIKTRNANNYQLRLVIEKHKRFFISTSFSLYSFSNNPIAYSILSASLAGPMIISRR